MRSPSTPLSDALSAPVTLPGYFTEILLPTSFSWRTSSRGYLPWNGNFWAGASFTLSGIDVSSSSSDQKGSITFTDNDNSVASLILNEGIAGASVTIWKFYTDAPADNDPIIIFYGVCDDVSASGNTITINLFKEESSTLYCPRQRVSVETGFTALPASGTLIKWNGETYTLQGESQ